VAGTAVGAEATTGVVVIDDDGCAGAGSPSAKDEGTDDSAGHSVGPLVAVPVKAVEVDEIRTTRRVMEEGSSFPLQTAWRDRVGSKGWGTTAKAWGWGGPAAGAAATAAMPGRATAGTRGVGGGTRAGGATATKVGRLEAAGKWHSSTERVATQRKAVNKDDGTRATWSDDVRRRAWSTCQIATPSGGTSVARQAAKR